VTKSGAQAKLADKWDRRLARQAASGQMVTRFCADEGISVAAFYYQLKKRRGRSVAKGSVKAVPKRTRTSRTTRVAAQVDRGAARSLFRQLRVTSGLSVSHRVKVRLPGGVELSFARDPDLVRQVLAQLLSTASSLSGGPSC
jgi:hypothetical protein